MGFFIDGCWYDSKESFELIKKQNEEYSRYQKEYLRKHYPSLYKED